MTDEILPESDLEKQLEEVAEGIRAPELPDFDNETEAKLSTLESQAKQRANQLKKEHDFVYREERGAKTYGDTGKGLGTGLVVAYAIMGFPLAGAGVGWLLNRATGGKDWVVLMMLAGFVGGIAFTISYVNRQNERP
ncbi:MAG: hypothetical protein ABL949_09890 [Fimbriimonadaceae bacterium]